MAGSMLGLRRYLAYLFSTCVFPDPGSPDRKTLAPVFKIVSACDWVIRFFNYIMKPIEGRCFGNPCGARSGASRGNFQQKIIYGSKNIWRGRVVIHTHNNTPGGVLFLTK